MASYLEHVKILQSTFEEFDIVQIPRLDNSHTDARAFAFETALEMP